MATATAHAKWTGTLKEGAGSMSGASGHLNAPFTFATRFEGAAGGTNPEELIGAAQAGCFSMFLAAQLTNAGHPPTSIETKATVHLGAGPTVTKMELDTVAVVPGVSAGATTTSGRPVARRSVRFRCAAGSRQGRRSGGSGTGTASAPRT